MKSLNNLFYETYSTTMRHSRNIPKPCEDYLICDTKNNIFIVLDGITRPHTEYSEATQHSASSEISEIFATAAFEIIANEMERNDCPETVLRNAVAYGNQKIAEYRSQKNIDEWKFYPGTLGIISFIKDEKLHYICAGDCLGMIIRNNTKICFGEQYSTSAIDLMKTTKEDRYSIYCNHPEQPLSYIIFNGDDVVTNNCEYSFLDLYKNDTIFLASDGIKNYLKYEKPSLLINLSGDELMSSSMVFDAPPFASYADDKALIRIKVL